jgi:hypothetical protein
MFWTTSSRFPGRRFALDWTAFVGVIPGVGDLMHALPGITDCFVHSEFESGFDAIN